MKYPDFMYGSGAVERCPSGLRCTLGKRVWGKTHRGFESPPLRHFSFLSARYLHRAHGVERTVCGLFSLS